MPVAPSTYSSAPCQASSPASVTTKEGIPKRVNSAPWTSPITIPVTIPSTIAR